MKGKSGGGGGGGGVEGVGGGNGCLLVIRLENCWRVGVDWRYGENGGDGGKLSGGGNGGGDGIDDEWFSWTIESVWVDTDVLSFLLLSDIYKSCIILIKSWLVVDLWINEPQCGHNLDRSKHLMQNIWQHGTIICGLISNVLYFRLHLLQFIFYL